MENPCDKPVDLEKNLHRKTGAVLDMAGGVAYVRMCTQKTHTQRLEAVEVK